MMLDDEEKEALFVRYLSGTISDEDKIRLDKWLTASEERRTELDEFKQTWDLTVRVAPDFEHLRAKAWESLGDKASSETKGTKKFKRHWYYRMAAAFVVLALAAAWYYFSQPSQEFVLVQSGKDIKSYLLPDGSLIWLDKGAAITYPKNFEGNRTIKLTGRAFFEVTKDSLNPFSIDADEVLVEVLGTSFEVDTRSEEANVSVAVSTGRVKVMSKSGLDSNRVLQPTEKISVSRETHRFSELQSMATNDLSWKIRRLVFHGTALHEVVDAASRYFGIRIRLANPGLEQCLFTGTFENPKQEQLLEALTITLNLTLTRQGNIIILDGMGCE